MLRTTTEISSPGDSHGGCTGAVCPAARQRPCSPLSTISKQGMDRENNRNSSCKGLPRIGIKEDTLTCEFSFSDAEIEQCVNKGGASFYRRSPQQDSSSYGHHNRWFHVLLTLVFCEGRRSWRVLKGNSFRGRRPSEGRSRCNEVVLSKRRGRSRALDLCGTASLMCVAEKAGLPI